MNINGKGACIVEQCTNHMFTCATWCFVAEEFRLRFSNLNQRRWPAQTMEVFAETFLILDPYFYFYTHMAKNILFSCKVMNHIKENYYAT